MAVTDKRQSVSISPEQGVGQDPQTLGFRPSLFQMCSLETSMAEMLSTQLPRSPGKRSPHCLWIWKQHLPRELQYALMLMNVQCLLSQQT